MTGNIFCVILKNKMAATGVSLSVMKSAYISLIIGPGNIFCVILKNKMAATGVSLSVMKSAYISLIIGPRGLGW